MLITHLGAWRNGRRYGLKQLSLVGEILQVNALKFRGTYVCACRYGNPEPSRTRNRSEGAETRRELP